MDGLESCFVELRPTMPPDAVRDLRRGYFCCKRGPEEGAMHHDRKEAQRRFAGCTPLRKLVCHQRCEHAAAGNLRGGSGGRPAGESEDPLLRGAESTDDDPEPQDALPREPLGAVDDPQRSSDHWQANPAPPGHHCGPCGGDLQGQRGAGERCAIWHFG